MAAPPLSSSFVIFQSLYVPRHVLMHMLAVTKGSKCCRTRREMNISAIGWWRYPLARHCFDLLERGVSRNAKMERETFGVWVDRAGTWSGWAFKYTGWKDMKGLNFLISHAIVKETTVVQLFSLNFTPAIKRYLFNSSLDYRACNHSNSSQSVKIQTAILNNYSNRLIFKPAKILKYICRCVLALVRLSKLPAWNNTGKFISLFVSVLVCAGANRLNAIHFK